MAKTKVKKSLRSGPDKNGYYGPFGSIFVGETLIAPLKQLHVAFEDAIRDKKFMAEYHYHLKHFIGRPSPLYYAENLTKKLGGAKILFKQEHLNHTGSHKANAALFQVLLAKRMGKKKILVESGAGAHFSATAACAAKFGIPVEGVMGSIDIKRVSQNVIKAKHYGAKLISTPGTLKDAITKVLKLWVSEPDSYYCCGSVVASHPFPRIVQFAQSVIGKELRKQILKQEKKLPDLLVGVAGGGSNFLGLIHEFLDEPKVKMLGVEAKNSAALSHGTVGIMQGMKSFMLQKKDGSGALNTQSIAAGIQFYSIGPQHSYLKSIGRVQYTSASDRETLDAYKMLAKYEGICGALEPCAALAKTFSIAKKKPKNYIIVTSLCGRGDVNLDTIEEKIGHEF